MAADASEPASTRVWTRERPSPQRSAPSVGRIVSHAVAIADAEGLGAVTMRRVANELRSGTASLYRYVTSRDELLELMIDAVQGEEGPTAPTGDWRADLAAVARRVRAVALRHPWLCGELTSRPALGPNSLRRVDEALGVALRATSEATLAAGAVATVRAFALGAVAAELAEIRAHRASGLTKEQWQASVQPYLAGLLDGGAYPSLARRVREADEVAADEQFEFGLSCVLDGLAARLT